MPRPSSKNAILERAVQMASVQGLEGLSIGELATATGKSKGGICAHFPNKRALQLAVVARAAEMFRSTVVEPAWHMAPGLERLEALTRRWFSYVEQATFEGGCFFTNAALELDGLEQPRVLEAVREAYRGYLDLLESCVGQAVTNGELAKDVEPRLLVLALHGLEVAALVRHALGEPDAYALARRAAEDLLARHSLSPADFTADR